MDHRKCPRAQPSLPLSPLSLQILGKTLAWTDLLPLVNLPFTLGVATRLGVSLVAQLVKNPPAMQDTWIQSLGWEEPLEEDMATHFILAWRISTDRGAWWAIVHGVTKSQTRLSNWAQHKKAIECIFQCLTHVSHSTIQSQKILGSKESTAQTIWKIKRTRPTNTGFALEGRALGILERVILQESFHTSQNGSGSNNHSHWESGPPSCFYKPAKWPG